MTLCALVAKIISFFLPLYKTLNATKDTTTKETFIKSF